MNISQPHILSKFFRVLKEIGERDLNNEIRVEELREEAARRFRITSRDIDITLREFERQHLIERLSERRRIRLR